MEVKIYTYKNCSSCRNATKWLNAHGITFEELPIRETPPEAEELEFMLSQQDGVMKALFNTSGRDYRALNLSAKLAQMATADAFQLLRENGNLVKRPFVCVSFQDDRQVGLVGFKEGLWNEVFQK